MAHRRTEAVDPARRRLRAVLLVALLLGAALVAVPRPAWAVTPVAAEPQDHQRLSDPPGNVTLAFERDVDPSVAKVIVVGPDGRNVTSGTLLVEGTNVTTQLTDDLPRGTYTVHFRIDGKNGEPEGGAYQFRYGSGSFTTLPDRSWSGEANEPAILRGTDPNGSEEPDPPSSASQTPGIEVTSEAPTSEPPPPTDEPSTVEPPAGTTSAAGSGPASATSASDSASAESGPSGSGSPWIIGGVLLLVALAGTGFGVWRTRRGSGAGADHE